MLSKRIRIDVYLPEKKAKVYRRLRKAIEAELLFTFGGCTVIEGVRGLYLSSGEKPEEDRITRVYADMPFSLDDRREEVSIYADALREAVAEALPEQSILVTVEEIYHSL
ncbi:MAG: hypothetical protein ABIR33_06660 [Pyrinomonadaceae bacterium]